MKRIALLLLLVPLSAGAMNKCEINGKIEYRQGPCPGGTDRAISGGSFSTLDTCHLSAHWRHRLSA
jgi:hypothetical protein